MASTSESNSKNNSSKNLPDDSHLSIVRDNVLLESKSEEFPLAEKIQVKGYNFETDNLENGEINYKLMLERYLTTGFQATNFGLAVNEIKNMLEKKFDVANKIDLPEAIKNQEEHAQFDFINFKRSISKCTIFFSFTSNLISSGMRDTIRFLAKNNMIDCIVTTAGGVEEDLIKCLGSTFLGDFKLPGKKLRKSGMNRIGNLIIPNENYCAFEDWLMPLLDQMADQKQEWTPSQIIYFLGEQIGKQPKGKESVWYWCWKNKIPVFSPALTDGSLGDMLYFHSYKRKLTVDIVTDLRLINTMAVKSINTGMLICGGGLIKHHTCNANLMRNGADHAVYITTAMDFDGSDAGANPDEAISWGKIKIDAKPVKLIAEVTLVLPLIVTQTFFEFKELFERENKKNKV